MKIRMIAPQILDHATTARMSEIAPVLDEEKNLLLVQEGENNRRSWGCVRVTSTIVVRTRTFAAVHVGVSHKYRGGQQWYFYHQPAGGTLTRITAAKLNASRRRQVLDAIADGKAPSWAKQPFSTAPRKPGKPVRHTRYKSVARVDGKLVSLYDGSEYQIGKTRREKAQPDHGGGFYVRRTPELAIDAPLPSGAMHKDTPRTILKCEVWGNCEIPDNDYDFDDRSMTYVPRHDAKEAWTYIKPLEIVHPETA